MNFDIEKIDKKNLLLVGIGNSLKSDDGVGCKVIKQLEKRVPKVRFSLLDAGSSPENHTKEIKDFKPKTIVFVDAAQMNEPPGTVKIIDEKEISSGYFTTHNMPLNLFFDYVKKTTKAKIIFIGIQPKSVKFAKGLSPEVQKAAAEVADYFSA